ncbi:MAG: HAMP domain-containing sensor histidine kinase [Gammaproteobacteria bacterium]|nr:HAMP domain-containing sensor histidine kinase [Gammaproteobacteria bacterium]
MPDMLGYILFFVAVAALPVVWRVSGQRAAARYRRALGRLDADARSGKIEEGDTSLPAEVGAVRQRLSSGWMPVRGASPEVLARLAQFLQTGVVKPLVQALHARGRGVRPRIQQALDAIEDIEFYAETPELARASIDLADAVQGVAREFQKAFKVEVKLDLPGEPVPCRADLAALQDAVYMILANAGRHGDGKPIGISLRNAAGSARIVVRDAGEGFSDEALGRAAEPFFSTVPGALGLGLTHARYVVQAHGGSLEVRNRGGGGEVVVALPPGEA